MIFLPNGLQAKLYRPPWFSFLLVIWILVCNSKILGLPDLLPINQKQVQIFIHLFQFQNPILLAEICTLILLFASYIELRVGPVLFFLSYLIGSAVGWILATFVFKKISIDLAVFGVTTLLSTFIPLFSSIKYRFVRFLLSGRKVFYFMPSSIIFILTQVFILSLNFAVEGKIPVTSLMATVTGILVGLIWSEAVFIKRGFAYPIEVNYLLRAKQEIDHLKKIDWILDCIKINSSNPSAIEYLFRSIAKSKVSAYFFTDDQKRIIAQLISAIIKKQVKLDMNLIIYHFSILPLSWNLCEIGINNLNERDLVFVDELLLRAEWRLSLRIYDVYLTYEENERRRNRAKKSITKILQELKRVGLRLNDEQWLTSYCSQMPNSVVSGLIKSEIKLTFKPTAA